MQTGMLMLVSTLVGMTTLGHHDRPSFQTEVRVIPVIRQSSGVFQVGEGLEYRVSYSFFTLGTIRFKVLDKFEQRGRTVYRAQTFIDSNPSLSWLADVHIRFEGEMDEEGFSYTWQGDDSAKKFVDVRKMKFDYDRQKLFYEIGKRFPNGAYKADESDTVGISARCQDGMSLFFYARKNFRQRKQVNVPTFVENKQVNTFINFLNERTETEIDAVKYPVEVNRFDGRADFVGVFGMNGGFEGWFSNDDAGIPIVARMKVILGSIKIELTRWNRAGWQPPKFERR